MKTKNLFGMLLLFLFAMGFISCGSDNEAKEVLSLSFEKEYYEVPLLEKESISIRGGNRNYSATVDNTDILDVSVDLSSPVGMGNLVISPKQKGETTVYIKDNIVNETVKLKIKIIDRYLAYAIKNSNHPALSQEVIVYMINNEAKDCYFFRHTTSEHELITKGTYYFSAKLEEDDSTPTTRIPYLTLNYASDEQGKFTDASIPPTPHNLRLELNDEYTTASTVIGITQRCLGVNWKELMQEASNRSVAIAQPTLKTTIDNTNYVIMGTLNTTPAIPENILE